MDEDRRKGMLCGLLAAGLRIEGLLRVAVERPETQGDIAPQIREEFNLYRSIFEQAWGESASTAAEGTLEQPEPMPEPEPISACVNVAIESDSADIADEKPEDDVVAVADVEVTDDIPVAAEAVETSDVPHVCAQDARPLADTLKVDELIARKESADLRRAFTLNDKFRFRRTLFGGSDAKFGEVLDTIEGMQSYSAAERYLAGVIDMDSEDSEDFMNIVNAHFGNKL